MTARTALLFGPDHPALGALASGTAGPHTAIALSAGARPAVYRVEANEDAASPPRAPAGPPSRSGPPARVVSGVAPGLGPALPLPPPGPVPLAADDRVVLVTDGVCDALGPAWPAALATCPSADDLLRAALTAGAADNLAAACWRWLEEIRGLIAGVERGTDHLSKPDCVVGSDPLPASEVGCRYVRIIECGTSAQKIATAIAKDVKHPLR